MHLRKDIRDFITSTFLHSSDDEEQLESQRLRDFITEFKMKYPNNSIKWTETITHTIEAEVE
jgi:transposase-like protein